jgi:hypothetical protein
MERRMPAPRVRYSRTLCVAEHPLTEMDGWMLDLVWYRERYVGCEGMRGEVLEKNVTPHSRAALSGLYSNKKCRLEV